MNKQRELQTCNILMLDFHGHYGRPDLHERQQLDLVPHARCYQR